MKLLLLAAVLYPLLHAVWEKEPFTSENIRTPDAQCYLDNSKIREQQVFFRQLKDPRLKASTIKIISDSNNPFAIKVLENILREEKNEELATEILAALYKLREYGKLYNPSGLKKYFGHKNPRLRAYAVSVYLDDSEDADAGISEFENEKSPSAEAIILEELDDHFDKLKTKNLKDMLESENEMKKACAAYLLALSSKNPDAVPELMNIASNGTVLSKIFLIRGLDKKERGVKLIMERLSGDKSPIIRKSVASVPFFPQMENIYIKLSSDSDWKVRQAASESLGSAKGSSSAVEALLKRLGDSYKPVRDSAEKSLVKLNPGEEFMPSLGALLKDSSARASAIYVLGELGAKKYAPEIQKILENTGNTDLKIRAVDALGKLEYKDAWKSICANSSSSNAELRKAVARAIGKIRVRQAYKSLDKLAKDKNREVVLEAVKAMGISGDKSYNPILYKLLKSNSSDGLSMDLRSTAAWALAKINSPDSKILKRLQDLCIKKVIVYEGEKNYDSDFVRAAALFALSDMSVKHDEATKVLKATLKEIKKPLWDTNLATDELKEYSRQIILQKKKKKVVPSEVPRVEPILTVQKYVEKKTRAVPHININN